MFYVFKGAVNAAQLDCPLNMCFDELELCSRFRKME